MGKSAERDQAAASRAERPPAQEEVRRERKASGRLLID